MLAGSQPSILSNKMLQHCDVWAMATRRTLDVVAYWSYDFICDQGSGEFQPFLTAQGDSLGD